MIPWFRFAPGSPSPEGFQINSLPNEQSSRPLGAVEALVARECQQIDAHCLNVDGHRPAGLGGIHQERDLPTYFANFLQRGNGSHNVGGMVDGDESGVFLDGSPQGIRVDVPLLRTRNDR